MRRRKEEVWRRLSVPLAGLDLFFLWECGSGLELSEVFLMLLSSIKIVFIVSLAFLKAVCVQFA